jgi:hypothetical protein
MLDAIVNTNINNQLAHYRDSQTRTIGIKERLIKILAIFSFILPLATIGNAQINKNTEFEIPFEFVVGDKVMPAGEYSLRTANDQNTSWMITGKSAKKTVFLLANTVEDIRRMNAAQLTFRQYGNRHFLAEFTVSDFRVTLSRTEGERFLRREFLASNKPVATRIVINQAALQTR